MIEVCQNCQEKFKARGTKRKFCSRSCYYSSIRKRATKNRVCGHCEKKFHVPPKEVKKGGGKFCSQVCYFAFRKIQRTIKCEYCHNLFERHHKNSRFCSWGCFLDALTEGKVHKYTKWVDCRGYLIMGTPGKSKFYHRHVAEKALGRELKPHEIVHHINGNKLDNRNKNLLICDQGYHRELYDTMVKLYQQKHLSRI